MLICEVCKQRGYTTYNKYVDTEILLKLRTLCLQETRLLRTY